LNQLKEVCMYFQYCMKKYNKDLFAQNQMLEKVNLQKTIP